ncbi:MAG: class I SAM-dependent methyltransferase, partial [Vulcanimicrobiaceae bacterium]
PNLFYVQDSARALTSDILKLIFGPRERWDFGVRLWDGTTLSGAGEPRFMLVLNEPSALRTAFTPPLDLNPGKAFVEGIIDIEGNAEAAVDTMASAFSDVAPHRIAALGIRLLRLPKAQSTDTHPQPQLHGRMHSRVRDSAVIGFHYDQPVSFYGLFLGEDLVYSCGYYDEGVDTVNDAQRSKIDHTLRKLRLRPGERLLDIGCGWGSLVIRAAKVFGAHAVGITLSRRQYEEARRRIAEAGLEGRASVELCDYRDLGERTFDKIVSVGMVEHVGRSRLAEYFRAARDALRPGGFFLNHGIADQTPRRRGFRSSGFLARYVFPDGELIPISDMLRFAERNGFEVRDVENLREHYARTLRDLVRNLERHRDAAIGATDERTYRIWRLYMAGRAQGFSRGNMGLFQSLLGKPDIEGRTPVPSTRRDLYRLPGTQASSLAMPEQV